MTRVFVSLTCASAMAAAAPVLAHRGHDDAIRVAATETDIRISFFAEAASLKTFDTNADGVLSRAEFDANAARIAQFVDTCLSARDGKGAAVDSIRRDQPIVGYADLGPQSPVKRVRFVRHYASKPRLAHLEFGCFPAAHGTRSVVSAGPIQVSFENESGRSATLSLR